MFGLAMPELIVILVIVVLLFGAGRIPKIAKEIGGGLRAFRESMGEKEAVNDSPHNIEPK